MSMFNKYYEEHPEYRQFYYIRMDSDGKKLSGIINTKRCKKNVYYICDDIILPTEFIFDRQINIARKEVVFADTQELAEKLYNEAVENGLMKSVERVRDNPIAGNKKRTVDYRYKVMVDAKVIEDKGGYFEEKF